MLETSGRRIGYARVSTKDQKLRMQLDGLKVAGCERIFEDHGLSGTKASRPGLDAALAELKPGDVLVVFKLDRLGRSVLHLADLLTRFEREGIHFCSLTEGINTTTPGGKFVYHIFAAVAELVRDLISENTRIGLEVARARGKTLGRPATVDIDVALEAHRLVVQDGHSVSELARRLDVSRSSLVRALERLDAAA